MKLAKQVRNIQVRSYDTQSRLGVAPQCTTAYYVSAGVQRLVGVIPDVIPFSYVVGSKPMGQAIDRKQVKETRKAL